MQAANQGAFETSGRSLGLTISLPNEQVTNPYLASHVGFYYFFVRKVCLSFSAEAFIYFPGGFGTMDEFFEIITLIQTKKIPRVPIILVGCSYWQPLRDFIQDQMVDKFKTVNQADLELFHISDDPEEIVEIVKKVPIRIG